MRNLKKLLALTLAMVMAFSLMLTANAAVKYDDYQDKDSIPTEFVEAVKVLTGLKVMQGDEKGFRPGDTITRAEAAAIIYRVATGDVNDAQVNIYSDYGSFTDVKRDDWFAGYVGYCQNAGYIKGTSPTTFNPYGQVTGYEALAMILRVVGYGKNNEFTGSEWQVNVAALSKQLQVTKNVVNANFETTLNYSARRDVVADLVFQTMATVPTVTYTPALAYNDKQSIAGNNADVFNPTLGQKIFGLYSDLQWTEVDEWGRPGYYWYDNGTWDGRTITGSGYTAYVISSGHPIYTATNKSSKVATITAAPGYETKEQVHECDVAQGLDFSGEHTFKLFVNGKTAVTDTYRVVATDTVTKVGGQGRVTEFYRNISSPWFTATDSRAVMIDTMLARVNSKTDAVLDPAGHVITPAKLEVTIYDGGLKTSDAAATTNTTVSERTISKPSSSKANWDQFNKGDYILIHGYTSKGATPAGNTNRNTQELLERAAFETNKVIDNTNHTLTEGTNVWIAKNDNNGIAPSIQGKQTVTYWNQGKHQVDGTDYNDQICLFLDRAGNNTNTTFTWFFDLYGNLIGIGDAKSTNYGVITAIYSAFVQGEGDTTGAVKAIATVKYANGETGTVQIDRFLMSTTETAANPWTVTPGTAKTVANTQLTAGLNTVDLRPLYDTTSHAAMTPGVADPVFSTSNAQFPGYIYIAPSTVSNTYAHFESATQDVYGILYDHMFEFTTANDNAVVAIEVAGSVNSATLNANLYVNKYNANVNNGSNIGMIYKNLGFLTLDTGATTEAGITGNAGSADVWLDNDTQIMVRTGTGRTNSNIVCYNGVGDLPGNVVLQNGTQVDWADTDGDGRADYVYVTGSSTGTVTYGLFYYNGGAAQWNGTTGTLSGWLNGQAASLTFTSYNLFSAINDSQNYDGHLFAVEITNDVVSRIMGTASQENGGTQTVTWTPQLLNYNSNTTGTSVKTFNTNITGNTTPTFVLGTQGGNTYSATTEAVFYRDSLVTDTNNTTHNVSYVRENRGNKIVVTNNSGTVAEYWIAPNAAIIGTLEWLNVRGCDVTIVYENGTALSATQVYITPDPDVTPETPNTVYNVTGSVSVLGSSTTPATLGTTIAGGYRNTVIYSPYAKNPTGLASNALDSSESPVNLLYFPYTAAAGTYTLNIYNGASLVYSEVATVSASGLVSAGNTDAHCFVYDIAGRTNTGLGSGLSTGVTYSFQIVGSSGAVVSSGSFALSY